MDRRSYLMLIGVGVTTGGSGCLELGADDTEQPSDETDDDSSVPDEDEDSPPEQRVRAYLLALDEGDVETAEQQLHPNSNLLDFVDEDDLEPGVEIIEVEERSFEHVVNERFDVENSDTVREMEANIESFVEDTGGDEFVHVVMHIESAEYGEEKSYPLVIREDDEWLMFGEVGGDRYHHGVP